MDNLCHDVCVCCVLNLERNPLNKEKVKAGLAIAKLSGNTDHLWSAEYTDTDVKHIMKYIEFPVYASRGLEITQEGERILNDISMR